MRSEQEFLVDVLQRLNSAGVDYMLTGSMASNYWGTPRTTHDVDIVVLLKPEQVDRFAAAFDHGFFIQRESMPRAGGCRLRIALLWTESFPTPRTQSMVSARFSTPLCRAICSEAGDTFGLIFYVCSERRIQQRAAGE